MLVHKTRFLTLNPGPQGAADVDKTIDEILRDDLKDPSSSKFAKLVSVAVTPLDGNRVLLTVIAEGTPNQG